MLRFWRPTRRVRVPGLSTSRYVGPQYEANLNDPQLKSIFCSVKSFSAAWVGQARPIFIEMEGPDRQLVEE